MTDGEPKCESVSGIVATRFDVQYEKCADVNTVSYAYV